jgi:hypothetical protein
VVAGPVGGLSAREWASAAYIDALGTPVRVLGRTGSEVYQERSVMLHRALHACQQAIGSERLLPREPDDDQLRAMAARLESLLALPAPVPLERRVSPAESRPMGTRVWIEQ